MLRWCFLTKFLHRSSVGKFVKSALSVGFLLHHIEVLLYLCFRKENVERERRGGEGKDVGCTCAYEKVHFFFAFFFVGSLLLLDLG